MSNGTTIRYQYTNNSRFLTNGQRDFYEENGYIVIKNLIEHDLLEQCRQRFVDICENRIPKRQLMILVKDVHLKHKGVQGEKLIDKIQHIVYDDVFFKFLNYEPLVNIVESIVGPNISTFHHMMINKPPNTTKMASVHPLHQDLQYFPIGPENSLVTSWAPLQKVDTFNGCLHVIPGSHKLGLLSHVYPEGGRMNFFQEVVGFEKPYDNKLVNLEMEKGDVVFFHPALIHGSGPNMSQDFRKALTAHYIDSGGYFEETAGTNRGLLIEEMCKLHKRLGYPEDIKDFFRYKTRLIKGEPGVFQFAFLSKSAK